MQKGHLLQFPCQTCQHPVCFSVFDLDQNEGIVSCSSCSLIYDFNEEGLRRQLRKFENLCRQIHLSEEILSHTAVGISLGDREIKIPFKILLTRLNSTLDLLIGDQPLTITFRTEPSKDIPIFEKKAGVFPCP